MGELYLVGCDYCYEISELMEIGCCDESIFQAFILDMYGD